MLELTTNQMEKISGGAICWGAIAAIAAGIVFIIGVIDGYTNPNKCNN